MSFEHQSVLAKEVIDFITPKDGGVYVDCTFGMGGHSRLILESASGAKIVAIDRDLSNQKYADEIKQEFNERFVFINDVFGNVGSVLKSIGVEKIDGVLYDLGVSSMQLDNPERGFSFSKDGPLLMQMGKNKQTAEEVVNTYSKQELADLIYSYGGEGRSRQIASAIVAERAKRRIKTTTQLSEIITNAVNGRGRIHEATKTFQAIRIKVNDELNQISASLRAVLPFLKIGGRIVVLTFHSLEDKVVKNFIKEHDARSSFFNRGEAINWAVSKTEKSNPVISVIKKGLQTSEAETVDNPRSRSAKMIVIEKINEILP